MSFLSKLSQNKQIIGIALGSVAIALLTYKSFNLSSSKLDPISERKRYIEVLRRNVNVENPSPSDIRKILQFTIQNTRKLITDYCSNFKQKRLQYNHNNRKENLKEYLELLYEGFENIQKIAIKEEEAVLREIGISFSVYKKYYQDFQLAMREIMKSDHKDVSHLKPISLEYAKFAIRRQIDFLKSEGKYYAELIGNVIREWPQEKRYNFSTILSMLVADCVFEGYPQIDYEQVSEAYIIYQRELMGEMQDLQIALTPVLLKINSGAFKNMDSYPGFYTHQIPEFPLERLQYFSKIYPNAVNGLGLGKKTL